MGRRRDAERTNNESGKGLSLYLDVNWKIRWAYSSRNYVNNFTRSVSSVGGNALQVTQVT